MHHVTNEFRERQLGRSLDKLDALVDRHISGGSLEAPGVSSVRTLIEELPSIATELRRAFNGEASGDEGASMRVPFCLLRNLDNAGQIAQFGGYIGDSQFLAVLGPNDIEEQAVCDWEPIDGHGGVVDWPAS